MLILKICFFVLILFSLFRAWLNSPSTKGKIGEFKVNKRARLFLRKKDYRILTNVTLSIPGGTTQIDLIIVSRFGVFVVETKNMKGWIFGGSHQQDWTQIIFHFKSKFQNPLIQNQLHVRSVIQTTGLNEFQVYSIVVFAGKSSFRTQMPGNVIHLSNFIHLIKSQGEVLFTHEEVNSIVSMLESKRLPKTRKTNRAHIEYVNSLGWKR